ncbi:MAG: hypothetical protein JSS27_17480 [Planctomycetes bacterium]|nr:hypothetical protein [Planctomycetota bacterium]
MLWSELIEMRSLRRCAFLALALCVLGSAPLAATEFEVMLPEGAHKTSGRLFVFLSAQESPAPMNGPNWFRPEPFFGLDVKDVQPGSTVRVDATADGYPGPLNTIEEGRYHCQAILHSNLDVPQPSRGVGNRYSPIVEASITRDADHVVKLRLNQSVAAQTFAERDWLKRVEIKSKLLSDFHRRPVVEPVGVVLPAAYFRDTEQRFPVIYSIPGFGGSHRDALRYAAAAPAVEAKAVDFIRVFLDGQCQWGHHCFADSATNGPRGQALIDEIIPEIDRRFRTIADPRARFLSGHSSGGWSSLWVQVKYPDTFSGVWSTAPDPVDFRDFQQIDLYAEPPQNMFTDPEGNRRPIARRNGKPMLWYDSFCKMDDVIKRGGQLRSFEAAFSQLADDGSPQKLWNRQTGLIVPAVAKTWEAYDISLYLERNWSRLEPKLRGKLHVYMGAVDTFYLEGAAEKLAARLKELGSDAEIKIVPDRDHSNLMTTEVYAEIRRQMSRKYREHFAEEPAAAK